MKTIQGIEYSFDDALLYKNRDNKDIVLFVDKADQLKKFEETGRLADAPVGIVPYSENTINEILSKMKKIRSFGILSNGKILVKYTNDEAIVFAPSNEQIVKEVMLAQRQYAQEQSDWTKANITTEEKETSKTNNKQKLTRGLAGVLAAIALVTGVTACNKKNGSLNLGDNPRIEGTVTKNIDFSKEGKQLFEEINSKDTFVLKYQQIAEINWDEQLATEVVEIMNGVYPTTMTYMSEENANAEMSEVLQAIELLIAGNINPETTNENIVDLSKYVSNTSDRVLLNNTSVICRNVVDESIGEPMNGQLLLTEEELLELGLNPCNPEDAEFINKEYMKFSREYLNSVDELLHYEYETINDSDYLQMNSGIRFVIASYFQNINNIIPQESYITCETSETTSRVNDVYYRYFFDEYEKRLYLPRVTQNGALEFYYDYYDSQNICHEEVYSMDTMFAMAGMEVTDDDRELNIDPNPNIHIMGIGPEVDARVDEAADSLINEKNTVIVK